jgi:hypothetical protein
MVGPSYVEGAFVAALVEVGSSLALDMDHKATLTVCMGPKIEGYFV